MRFVKYNRAQKNGSTTVTGGISQSITSENAEHAYTADYATNADHANNADNATYASNADRLTNPVTVYGNEFDGTQNLTNITANTINTKDLKVTGRAEFFELVIDQVKSVGGAQILSPADGFEINYVWEDETYHILYWLASDGENETQNKWQINDQALCMDFNNQDASTYYWALVEQVGTTDQDPDGQWIDVELGMYDGGAHKKYHYIQIDDGDCDGVITPEIGQNVVMLGNRIEQNRQSAIYMSAYDGLDTGLTAPFYAQYINIDDYDLASHRNSYFDARGSLFTGDFKIGGQNADTYINNKVVEEIGKTQDINLYTYFKYSTGPNGSGTVSDTDSSSMRYIGTVITTTPIKPTDVTKYTWRYKSDQSEYYNITDVGSYYYVDKDGENSARCYVNLNAVVVKYSATGGEIVADLPTDLEMKTFTNLSGGRYAMDKLANNIWHYEGNFVYREGVVADYYGVALQNVYSEAKLATFTKELQIVPQAVFEMKQGIDASIALKVNSTDLAATGIDIEQRKITLTANNFTIVNNANQETMGVNADGDLVTKASGEKQIELSAKDQAIHIKGPVDEGTDASGNTVNIDNSGIEYYNNQSYTLLTGGLLQIGNPANPSSIEIDAENGIRTETMTLVDIVDYKQYQLFVRDKKLIIANGGNEYIIANIPF